jgi:hypothetical protein
MTERPGLSRRQALKYGGLAAAVPLLPAMRPAEKSRHSEQDGWEWCDLCQGLWYAVGSHGSCPSPIPTVGFHDFNTSGNDYVLSYDDSTPGGSHGDQDNWALCSQCQGLFYALGGNSACPATIPGFGSHDTSTAGYSLKYRHH